MKLLFIFCDMLMANNLKTFNNEVSNYTLLDKVFNYLGGIAYTEAYTGTPESYRSMASFITGLLPKDNGIRSYMNRVNYSLDINSNNLYKILYDKGFKIIMHSLEKTIEELLPKNYNKIMTTHRNISGCLREYKSYDSNENVALFINLLDYHIAVDRFNNKSFGKKKFDLEGQREIFKKLKIIFRCVDKKDFDEIFIFSDHGAIKYYDNSKITRQIRKISYSKFPLIDDRIKIVLFWHSKNRESYGEDKEVTINNNLVSIMDIFPTILDKLKLPYNYLSELGGGISLCSENSHKFITFEDFDNYSQGLPGDVPRIWAVKTKKFYYIENLYTNMLFKLEKNTVYKKRYHQVRKEKTILNSFEDILSSYTSSYKIVKSEKESFLKFYKDLHI